MIFWAAYKLSCPRKYYIPLQYKGGIYIIDIIYYYLIVNGVILINRGFRVISSRILNKICLLIGEHDIRAGVFNLRLLSMQRTARRTIFYESLIFFILKCVIIMYSVGILFNRYCEYT